MYGGRIVEAGTVQEIFAKPRHPYTRGLLDASDLDEDGPAGTFAGDCRDSTCCGAVSGWLRVPRSLSTCGRKEPRPTTVDGRRV
jgi:ABC-type dipeptide/oligopeptide/nickel transport system ATPase component